MFANFKNVVSIILAECIFQNPYQAFCGYRGKLGVKHASVSFQLQLLFIGYNEDLRSVDLSFEDTSHGSLASGILAEFPEYTAYQLGADSGDRDHFVRASGKAQEHRIGVRSPDQRERAVHKRLVRSSEQLFGKQELLMIIFR